MRRSPGDLRTLGLTEYIGGRMQIKTSRCGPELISRYVPDHLLHLDISNECLGHDEGYVTGTGSRRSADKIFLIGMLRKINDLTEDPVLRAARRGVAYMYYFAVRFLGWIWYQPQKKS